MKGLDRRIVLEEQRAKLISVALLLCWITAAGYTAMIGYSAASRGDHAIYTSAAFALLMWGVAIRQCFRGLL